MDVYNEFTGLRSDGRRPNEMRDVDAEIGCVAGCTGSSHFKLGQTEVIAQVFGPRDNRSGDNLAEIKVSYEFADFAKAPHPSDTSISRRGRESEVILKRTFEAAIKREIYPHSEIVIAITIIQDDGSAQCAAINAATLALIDAGIPMPDFVVCMTASLYNDKCFLDAGRQESTNRFPAIEVAVFPRTREIVSMNMTARIQPADATNLMSLAIDGCGKLHEIMANTVRLSSLKRVAQSNKAK